MSFGLFPFLLTPYYVVSSMHSAQRGFRCPLFFYLHQLMIFIKLSSYLRKLGISGTRWCRCGICFCNYLLAHFFHCYALRLETKSFSEYQLFKKWGKISFRRWKEILFIGVPIGISIFVETSIFSAVTL